MKESFALNQASGSSGPKGRDEPQDADKQRSASIDVAYEAFFLSLIANITNIHAPEGLWDLAGVS
jgi:hypothetical protein